ncbi:MAG: hypothetical protein P8X75_03750 [Limibacillus sp.]|jgi:hypothetical protein
MRSERLQQPVGALRRSFRRSEVAVNRTLIALVIVLAAGGAALSVGLIENSKSLIAAEEGLRDILSIEPAAGPAD